MRASSALPFETTCQQLMAILQAGDPWWYDEEQDVSAKDLFRACAVLGDASAIMAQDPSPVACGSVAIPETAQGLYRLLFLLQPPAVTFAEGGLFYLTSPDQQFIVSVELYKYELGLYYYCPQTCMAKRKNNYGIIAGWPGAENGWACTDPVGQQFFAMVALAAQTPWGIYGGNDFVV